MDVVYRDTTALLWVVYSMCVFFFFHNGVCFLLVRDFAGHDGHHVT